MLFRSTRVTFSLAFTLISVLAGLFGLWLASKLPRKRNFLTALCTGLIAQIGAAWFPADGPTLWPHIVFATILVFMLPLVIYYHSLGIDNSTIRSVDRVLIALELIAIVLLPISISWHISLLAEGLSFVSFHCWIVMTTFASDTYQPSRTPAST